MSAVGDDQGSLKIQQRANVASINQTAGGFGGATLVLNASYSSPVYRGDVTTVTPEAFRTYCLIRYE